MVCLKPCDTYSFNQLLKEHRVDREKAYIVGVGCKGKLDIEKIRKMGIKGIRGISGAEITGDAETLTVDTVYGEKPVHTKMPCWNAAMYVKEKSIKFTMN